MFSFTDDDITVVAGSQEELECKEKTDARGWINYWMIN